MAEKSEEKLRLAMQAARDEYTSLNSEFDTILFDAHLLRHGSPAMLDTLRKANAFAPQVRDALGRYVEAVRELTTFYQDALSRTRVEHESKDERAKDAPASQKPDRPTSS